MQFRNRQEILQKKYNKCSQLSGFTYIELLISMLVMFLLFGVGFANYRDFQRREQVQSAARMVLSDLRLAQESALSGRKVCPSTEVLLNYSFQYVDPDTYNISEVCTPIATPIITLIKSVDLQGALFDVNSTFITSADTGGTIRFLPVGKGTNITAGAQRSIILRHSSTSLTSVTETISVFSSGAIVE